MLAYWALVLASINSVVDKSKLEYLLHSFRSYTPVQRAALASGIFEDSVLEIAMTRSVFTDNNVRAYDALIPDIFGT